MTLFKFVCKCKLPSCPPAVIHQCSPSILHVLKLNSLQCTTPFDLEVDGASKL